MEFTEGQKGAFDAIYDWYYGNNSQFFFLSGYAGTGKTTIIEHLVDYLDISNKNIEMACYTGKATMVLKSKLSKKYKVRTIHKLIYNAVLLDDIAHFRKKNKRAFKHCELIVIDEASMIDSEIFKDLLSYGVKILFVGDIGQLPPVLKGDTSRVVVFDNPDYMLTEIVRQGAVSPIIELSRIVREGKPFKVGDYGAVKIISKNEFMKDNNFVPYFKHADQIVCGYNRTRKDINNVVRTIKGFKGDLPSVGEKIICLRNNKHEKVGSSPLVNGMIGSVLDIYDFDGSFMNLDFEVVGEGVASDLYVDARPFEKEVHNVNGLEYDNGTCYFDFGYAITCHKSQGSEWRNVVVMNEVLDSSTHSKWLYTAVTRASENLVLVI